MRPLASTITGPLTVIGDVHGQAASLQCLLDRLRARADFGDRWIVFVGDFMDRGPDPRAALDMVLSLREEHPNTTAVMGNHDLALTAALRLVSAPPASNWPQRYVESYDSGPTFASYGVAFGDLPALAKAMPAAHKRFLTGLPWRVEHEKYLVVHAGLLPNEPFADQLALLRRRDFTLNRPAHLCDRALNHAPVPAECPVTVVSGHVPVLQVTFSDRRILVDTTGGTGGNLSAVLLPEGIVITSASDTASLRPAPHSEQTYTWERNIHDP